MANKKYSIKSTFESELESGIEYLDGVKYLDGVMCNDTGLAITEENGYSPADEEFARQAYDKARKSCPINSRRVPDGYGPLERIEKMQEKKMQEILKRSQKRKEPEIEDVVPRNDAGLEISVENGYSPDEVDEILRNM